MAQRPHVVAFDVIETLFPLAPMRVRLVEASQPGNVLELWFARILRDAFALTAAGDYRTFAEVAASALVSVTKGAMADPDVEGILAGFPELEPHTDAEPALRAVRAAGVRAITLTNGSAANTEALLRRAGLEKYVERAVSVDEVRVWKPAAEPYLHAAAVCGVQPAQMALVAAHSWDIHGARHAGLTTGWVSRLEGQPPAVFDAADVSGPDLATVVAALLG
jgi:2-haloacid dehalogenase